MRFSPYIIFFQYIYRCVDMHVIYMFLFFSPSIHVVVFIFFNMSSSLALPKCDASCREL